MAAHDGLHVTETRAGDDPYAILGVARDSDDATIAAAHRTLARRWHPDIAGEAATTRMMRINAAFDAIRTQERRAAFDGLDRWAATPGRDGRDTAGATPEPPGWRTAPRWSAPRDGTGGAGPPPGRPSGSVLGFGRHKGWSIGEIARVDPGYLEWLSERRDGEPYLAEIDAILKRIGFRPDPAAAHQDQRRPRRGVFRR